VIQNGNTALIQEIKEKNDIVSVISEYVTLRRAGRSYIGLCPFHSEKTPSFNVNQTKQFFYCFGCGTGGDVISFLMKIENLEFIEAARRLAERAGIPWPDRTTDETHGQKAELLQINKLTAIFYHQCLLKTESGRVARAYLEKRGISSEIWSKFYLGYAAPGWHHLTNVLRRKGIRLELAESLGLVSLGENGFYDRFRERLIFPIADARGNICGFGGRVFDNSHPKYLNSPDTVLFHKGYNLYGLNLAKEAIRKSGHAIIVEGYMDVIQAHQGGFCQTVASLGTALTAEQAKMIKRYTNQVVLAYDADAAGQNATIKGMNILRENGLDVKILIMPEGHDPDSFIRTFGAHSFGELLANAVDFLDFMIQTAVRSHDLSNPAGKASVINELLPYLATVDSVIVREEYFRKLSREVGITETAINEEFRLWVQKHRKKNQILDRNIDNSYTKVTSENNRPYPGFVDPGQLTPLKKAIFETEKELLQFALQEYDKFARIKEKLLAHSFSFDVWQRLWDDLLAKNPDFQTFEAICEEISSGFREVAVSLLAEAEVKEVKTEDIDGIFQRLEMLHLKERIQILTQQISSGKDEAFNPLTEEALKEKIIEFTQLKKRLQRDYPNFAGEL